MALPFQSALKHKVRWKTVDVMASLEADECVSEGGMCSAILSYTSATEEITGVKEQKHNRFPLACYIQREKKKAEDIVTFRDNFSLRGAVCSTPLNHSHDKIKQAHALAENETITRELANV